MPATAWRGHIRRGVEFLSKDLAAAFLPLANPARWKEALRIIECFHRLNANGLRSSA
jgi:hypothetical protein